MLMSMPPPPEDFDVNKPFVYGIFDEKANVNAFIGQVSNPLEN